VNVPVIDRRNYNLFVPLLYQVATAALSPADISTPIRRVLARYRNIETIMADVVGIDADRREVVLAEGKRIAFDALVLATGSSFNYFGHDDWHQYASGPKSIPSALRIRASLLRAFERAEASEDPEEKRSLLTIAIVGGGPTGVEMAGAIAELTRYTLKRDFRHINPALATILLIDAGPRLLAAFSERLSRYAAKALARLSVTVLLDSPVESIQPGALVIKGKRVAASTIIWGGGVRGSEAAAWLTAPRDSLGRLMSNADLSIQGFDHVYGIGDAVNFQQDGKALPALAQVAKQQGIHLGRALKREFALGKPLPPFRYRSRGDTAVIGRHAAIYQLGRWEFKGFAAWVLWAFIHIYLLIGVDKRILVAVQWFWRYLTYEAGARLIT
jgi:NADH dehydrogenase